MKFLVSLFLTSIFFITSSFTEIQAYDDETAYTEFAAEEDEFALDDDFLEDFDELDYLAELEDELLDIDFDFDDSMFDDLADVDMSLLDDDDFLDLDIEEEPALGYNEDQVRQFFEENNQTHDPFEDEEIFSFEGDMDAELVLGEEETFEEEFKDIEESIAVIEEAIPQLEVVEEPVAVVEEPMPVIEEPIAVIEEPAPVIEEPAPVIEEPQLAAPAVEVISVSDEEVSFAPPIPATTATVRGGIKLYEDIPEEEGGNSLHIQFKQVFAGSPIIYSLLGIMSIGSFGVWFYTLGAVRGRSKMPKNLLHSIEEKISDKRYDEALNLCNEKDTIFCKMISAGISSRGLGFQSMLDNMRTAGRRASVKYWQRIAILNDIAIVAPMLGLLGTVLGMFYAFYDLNRSQESVSALFDGLGISVGTTVAGLVVAILAMIFHSITKFRLVRSLTHVENEVHSVANLISKQAEES